MMQDTTELTPEQEREELRISELEDALSYSIKLYSSKEIEGVYNNQYRSKELLKSIGKLLYKLGWKKCPYFGLEEEIRLRYLSQIIGSLSYWAEENKIDADTLKREYALLQFKSMFRRFAPRACFKRKFQVNPFIIPKQLHLEISRKQKKLWSALTWPKYIPPGAEREMKKLTQTVANPWEYDPSIHIKNYEFDKQTYAEDSYGLDYFMNEALRKYEAQLKQHNKYEDGLYAKLANTVAGTKEEFMAKSEIDNSQVNRARRKKLFSDVIGYINKDIEEFKKEALKGATKISNESEADEEQDVTNLKVPEIALLYIFQDKVITKINSGEIAKLFGNSEKYSGKSLFDWYTAFKNDIDAIKLSGPIKGRSARTRCKYLKNVIAELKRLRLATAVAESVLYTLKENIKQDKEI